MLGALASGTRPRTLTAAIAPVLVGSALVLAVRPGAFELWLTLFALASALCIQIGTNFFNDVLDFRKGADTEDRQGPVRLSQSGALSPRAVTAAGAGSFVLACLFALPLVWYGGPVIVAIGLASLLCGYLYTGGPAPLAYVGLGEVFVLIFFGFVAVGGIFYLHTHALDAMALVAGAQVGLLACVLIAINNLRDRTNDARARKRTMAVRLGERNAKFEIAAVLCAPVLLGAFWIARGWLWAGVLPLLFAPSAALLIRDLFRTEPGRAYNGFLARSAKIQIGFAVLLSLGLWVGARVGFDAGLGLR
jgi:1,4-dihydroxy-2-naphthoate octaprenyltransferase